MKRLSLVAAALLVFMAIPAFAQTWGAPGSAATVDQASAGLYEVSGATLRFKSGQTGTIVARVPVGFVSVEDPQWQFLTFTYGGSGVSLKLYSSVQCDGTATQEAAFGPSSTTSNYTCSNVDVTGVDWDTYANVYWVEVTLTRTSTSTNPQFHLAQLQ